ncbi:MAG: hypothetical protein GXO48_07930 [Chlorobi bacterium]|nr:hypothetical protein [Chlorobiota bacterium]
MKEGGISFRRKALSGILNKRTVREIIGLILCSATWGPLTVNAQNIGIGTTTPQAHLHVTGHYATTTPLFQVDVDSTPTPFLIIQPDGRVGIGVSSPSEVLDISGNVRFSGALMPGGDAGSSGQVLVSQGPGTAPQWQDATSVGGDNWGSQVAQTQAPIVGDGTATSPITLQSGASTGDILIWDGSQWQVSLSPFVQTCSGVTTNYVQKWTGTDLCNSIIYDNGTKVGIGTSTPFTTLDVSGWVAARSKYGDTIYIGGDGSGNDAEIGIYAPLSRNWITMYNRAAIRYASIKADSAVFKNTVFAQGPGNNVFLGNMLIGTVTHISPYKLQVTGEVLLGTSTPTASAGNANVFIGADAANDDIELGSINPNIEWLSIWNRTASGFMSVKLDTLWARGHIMVGSSGQQRPLASRITICTKWDPSFPQSVSSNHSYQWQSGDCDNGLPSGTCMGFISSARAGGNDEDWEVLLPGVAGGWGNVTYANGGIAWAMRDPATNGLYVRVIYFCW